jgi:hypothetical protein
LDGALGIERRVPLEQAIDAAHPRQPQNCRDLMVRQSLAPQPVSAGSPKCGRLDPRQPGPPAGASEHVTSRSTVGWIAGVHAPFTGVRTSP